MSERGREREDKDEEKISKIQKNDAGEKECNICFDETEKSVGSYCPNDNRHTYHKSCLQKWAKNQKRNAQLKGRNAEFFSCPTCRSNISLAEFTPASVLTAVPIDMVIDYNDADGDQDEGLILLDEIEEQYEENRPENYENNIERLNALIDIESEPGEYVAHFDTMSIEDLLQLYSDFDDILKYKRMLYDKITENSAKSNFRESDFRELPLLLKPIQSIEYMLSYILESIHKKQGQGGGLPFRSGRKSRKCRKGKSRRRKSQIKGKSRRRCKR